MAEEQLEEFRLFIDGKTVDALTGRTFGSLNPDTGRPWARVADGGPEDVDVAVGAARAAFDGEWGQLTGFQRAAVLRACAEGIAANAERLARLEVQDSGKLLREMLGQMTALPQWFFHFSGLAHKLEGRTIPPVNPNYFGYTPRAGRCGSTPTGWSRRTCPSAASGAVSAGRTAWRRSTSTPRPSRCSSS